MQLARLLIVDMIATDVSIMAGHIVDIAALGRVDNNVDGELMSQIIIIMKRNDNYINKMQ